MRIKTVNTWDDELWQDANPLYLEAFGNKGAKPVHIIKNMFAQGIAELHVGYNESVAVVMALTGKIISDRVMIIDYLAVSEKERGSGLGKYLVDYLREKAASEGYQKLVIEAESEETPSNRRRIHFWQSCGFFLTHYVHHSSGYRKPIMPCMFPLMVIRERSQERNCLCILIRFIVYRFVEVEKKKAEIDDKVIKIF